MAEWKPHSYRVGPYAHASDEPPTSTDELEAHRKRIEPWLSAVFQSEHLSLLLGSGFTIAFAHECNTCAPSMDAVEFKTKLAVKVNEYAAATALRCGRGQPNVEDQIRAATQLVDGLTILKDRRATTWRGQLESVLKNLLSLVLQSEAAIQAGIEAPDDTGVSPASLLVSFLMSFASRAATRERLNVFTTNYDRLIVSIGFQN
jgi:hypothetical protein